LQAARGQVPTFGFADNPTAAIWRVVDSQLLTAKTTLRTAERFVVR